jgi:hypothetical protein
MRIFKGVVAILALFILTTTTSFAATFIKPDTRLGRTVLSVGEEYKNVYTAGNEVRILGDVKGDLFAAGGDISVDGTVEQDLTLAGGTISLQNQIGGDARIAGGTITINNQVTGDLLVAGGKVILSEKSKVSGDVIVAGGQVSLEGPVAGKVWIGGGQVYINSEIAGEVKIKNSEQVIFGPKAKIASKVTVLAAKDPILEDGASVPDLSFTLAKPATGQNRGLMAGLAVTALALAFLGYVVVGLLLAWLAPRKAGHFVTAMKTGFWVNLGVGLAAMILMPILSILLMITGVGVYAGLILLFAYALLWAIAWLMALIFAGSLSSMLVKRTKTMEVTWQTAILGAVVYLVLRLIPVVGWIVMAGLMLAAFGQWMAFAKHFLLERKATAINE